MFLVHVLVLSPLVTMFLAAHIFVALILFARIAFAVLMYTNVSSMHSSLRSSSMYLYCLLVLVLVTMFLVLVLVTMFLVLKYSSTRTDVLECVDLKVLMCP
jgi:hypothetical protein